MLTYKEAKFIQEYIEQFLEKGEYPVNVFAVIAVLTNEGLIDEEKIRRFIEERK